MLYIKGTEIQLTRGDTAYLEVPLVVKRYAYGQEEPTKEPYEMSADDTLRLTVKKTLDGSICFQKTVKGNNMIKIVHEDTCDCEFGKYKYDIELTTAIGDTFTVIDTACFKVLTEVTC